MSTDRWNAALEAAAKVCEKWADKYRLSTTHRTDALVAAAMMCSQAILALREADQRGATAEASLKTGVRLNAPDTDSDGELVSSAKGSAAIAPSVEASQSAPHHPGGQEKAAPTALASSDPEGHLQAMSDAELPAPAAPNMVLVPREPKRGLLCGDVAISTDPRYAGWVFVRHVDGENWTTGAKLTPETWAMLVAIVEARNAT